MFKCYPAFIVPIIIALCVQVASAADWPWWRGPARDGISTETAWRPAALANPKILWKATLGKGYSSMAIRDGRLYTMGNDGRSDTVFCFDAESGREIWRYTYRCSLGQYPGPRATPTVDGGVVYTFSQEGHLYCFDAADGEVLWHKHVVNDYWAWKPQWGFASSAVVYGDLLILNAGVYGLALNKKTGEKVWASESGTGGYASPVIFEYRKQPYAAIFGQKALYVVHALTGAKLAQYPWATRFDVNAADPLVVGNKIFISSDYGKGCALLELNGGTLTKIWDSKKFASHFSSFIYLDGHIYGNDCDARRGRGTFRCLELDTGKEKWAEKKKDVGSLIMVGDKLLLMDGRGDLFIIEATHTGYREVASARVLKAKAWTPPAFSNGRLYCRNVWGDLVCIDMR